MAHTHVGGIVHDETPWRLLAARRSGRDEMLWAAVASYPGTGREGAPACLRVPPLAPSALSASSVNHRGEKQPSEMGGYFQTQMSLLT